MGLTVEQINKQEFSTKMRGYNQNEVQQFMATVAQTVQELTEENHALKETVKADEGKLKYFSELKDSLNKSILVAQEAADKVKNNAKREADIMIREAQKQATDIVSEANEKANQVVERSTEETRKLTTETNDLKKQTRIFRQRLQVMLESQLEVVKSDEWDKLLADEDLDQYNEIQKILGKNLDNDSSESVESTAISSEADQDQAAMAQQPAVEQPAADAGETVVVFPDSDQGKN
ncbi:DivIVA domain-containing protein [Limosilactobacillus oris]|uniref:DivIVA domain-containing protein n=1 Tax=Limosilactobacillus oris TaxID=1632 RepID=UPI0022363216|nr:DivIVA domain-containing protein [Limosilactobacillus oris]MCW4388130.1 DivIVA domain-containing protein [Limosilactobacillus oris]